MAQRSERRGQLSLQELPSQSRLQQEPGIHLRGSSQRAWGSVGSCCKHGWNLRPGPGMCRKTEDESGDSLRPRPVMEWMLTPRDVQQMLTVTITAVLLLFPLRYHHYFHSLASPQLLLCTQETALLTLAPRLAVSG